ncbi:MAG TPA: cysteine dioxygenase family protein [Thermomicrobiaceae bacterium]|nr:cysteine dioxygenase family protein [Thermomicrobiaceae bacterium]
MTMTPTRHTSLEQLVAGIRGAIAHEPDVERRSARVADVLAPLLADPSFLTEAQRQPDPSHYRQHVLHVEPDGSFSVVALVWLPGQETPIHDHVSWCVVGVHEGQEFETRYRLEQRDDAAVLVADGHSVNPVGSTAALTPPGDIHKVANPGPGMAISLHVYGADIGRLGSSIRRRYDLPLGEA